MIKINALFMLAITSACTGDLSKDSHGLGSKSEQNMGLPQTKQAPKAPDKKKTGKLNQVNDKQRQHDISEEFSKDNFNYEALAKVDWANPDTYGELGYKVTLSNSQAHISPNFKTAGITPEHYYHVGIAGDGNCWLRAAWVSFLLWVLDKDQQYVEFIERLDKFYDEYQKVPGFSERYFAAEFKQLIEVLKKAPPKKRLEILNRIHVDNFLIYTLRSLIHARYYLNKLDNLSFHPEQSNSYIKNSQLGNPGLGLIGLFVPSQKKYLVISTSGGSVLHIFSETKVGTLHFYNYGMHYEEKSNEFSLLKKYFGVDKNINLSDLYKNEFLAAFPIYSPGHYCVSIRKDLAQRYNA
ncbi:MAG: hypothetical protein KC505_01130 [Myxococcales bacterium]|nr:hypothetical protein [Myxococcales bacterium]USN50839.1 MAG: hypothetical protein H6731_11410 [Myxococcales bacterium]